MNPAAMLSLLCSGWPPCSISSASLVRQAWLMSRCITLPTLPHDTIKIEKKRKQKEQTYYKYAQAHKNIWSGSDEAWHLLLAYTL